MIPHAEMNKKVPAANPNTPPSTLAWSKNKRHTEQNKEVKAEKLTRQECL
jgi:hypothetical protein